MASPFEISDIVDSPSKLAILRVFTSRKNLKATGRELARRAGYSVPSTHASLKDLYSRNIVTLEIIGRQHIYSLNEDDRIVKKIIRPMFKAENGIKEEIRDFLTSEIKKAGVKQKIISLILYGSIQQGSAGKKSDVDISVVVSEKTDLRRINEIFDSLIMPKFRKYFGIHLDPYIKSATDFRNRLKNKQAPVSTLMKSYSVLYGKEPLEI